MRYFEYHWLCYMCSDVLKGVTAASISACQHFSFVGAYNKIAVSLGYWFGAGGGFLALAARGSCGSAASRAPQTCAAFPLGRGQDFSSSSNKFRFGFVLHGLTSFLLLTHLKLFCIMVWLFSCAMKLLVTVLPPHQLTECAGCESSHAWSCCTSDSGYFSQ